MINLRTIRCGQKMNIKHNIFYVCVGDYGSTSAVCVCVWEPTRIVGNRLFSYYIHHTLANLQSYYDIPTMLYIMLIMFRCTDVWCTDCNKPICNNILFIRRRGI